MVESPSDLALAVIEEDKKNLLLSLVDDQEEASDNASKKVEGLNENDEQNINFEKLLEQV